MSKDVIENKIFHYYLRDTSNHPFACIAFQPHFDGKVSRGVSICSVSETWKTKKGRDKAIGRLRAALVNESDSHPFRESLIHDSLKWYMFNLDDLMAGCPNKLIRFKSCYKDDPTEFEKRIMTKPADKE